MTGPVHKGWLPEQDKDEPWDLDEWVERGCPRSC